MKVKELIEKLREYNEDYEVFMSDETVGVVAEPKLVGLIMPSGMIPGVNIVCQQTSIADRYADET